MPALPLINCVTLDQSELQGTHFLNKEKLTAFPLQLHVSLNDMTHLKYLAFIMGSM